MFKDGIKKTIAWYLEHEDWMNNVTSGDYQKYYADMYKDKQAVINKLIIEIIKSRKIYPMRKVFLLFTIILFEETVDGRLCRLVTRYGRKWT